jgi:hypothetical protein
MLVGWHGPLQWASPGERALRSAGGLAVAVRHPDAAVLPAISTARSRSAPAMSGRAADA